MGEDQQKSQFHKDVNRPPKNSSGLKQQAQHKIVGAAAESAVNTVMSDDVSEEKKQLAKAAVRGAAVGAMRGGFQGAATGAATESIREKTGQNNNKKSEKNISDENTENAEEHSTAQIPVLGAGGTSLHRDKSIQVDSDKNRANSVGDSAKKTTKKTVLTSAAAASPPAATMALLILFLNWLKSFFFAVMAQVLSLLQLLMMWLAYAAKAAINFVMKPFMALGATIAKAVAAVTGGAVISTTVAATGAAVVSGVTVLAFVMGLLGVLNTHVAANDASVSSDCVVTNANIVSVGDTKPVDANAEKNAQAAYSVFKTWGMSDENIAGILGNWTQESGIDPTSVQNFPTGVYAMTDTKKNAALEPINGIGLGQWTAARNTLLRNYASAKNTDWWELGLQLRFMADTNGDNPSDVQAFKTLISTPQGSPRAAAVYFHDKWERSADSAAGIASRGDKAEAWFAKMSGWTVDQGVVENTVGDFVSGAGQAASALVTPVKNACQPKDGSTTTVALKDGGMTQDEAQKLVDLYNQEGDAFLKGRYGTDGPGSCGDNKAMNCVSFTTYFMNKYTKFQQYARGNGIDTAGVTASMTGKQVSTTPTPYSVGSGPGVSPEGHTLVVLGVQGDKVFVGEAAYCMYMGRVSVMSAASMTAAGWKFVDMSDQMLPNDQVKKT